MSDKNVKKLSQEEIKARFIKEVTTVDFASADGLTIQLVNHEYINELLGVNLVQILQKVMRNYATFLNAKFYPLIKLKKKKVTVTFVESEIKSSHVLCDMLIGDKRINVFIDDKLESREVEINIIYVLHSILLNIFHCIDLMDFSLVTFIAVTVEEVVNELFESDDHHKLCFKCNVNVDNISYDSFKASLDDKYDVMAKLKFNPLVALSALIECYKSYYPTKFRGNFVFKVDSNSKKSKNTSQVRVLWSRFNDDKTKLEKRGSFCVTNVMDRLTLSKAITEFLYKFSVWNLKNSKSKSIFDDHERLFIIEQTVENVLYKYREGIYYFL